MIAAANEAGEAALAQANKTQATAADPAAFLAAVEPEAQRRDAADIVAMMAAVSGAPPILWGSIVGFGRYAYRYDSGRTGEAPRLAMSPRKGKNVVYFTPGLDGEADLLARLGPHEKGKSCLYLKSLDGIDRAVLRQLMERSWAIMAARYPD
jgi:hypothetical protein